MTQHTPTAFRITYGLLEVPTNEQIRAWAVRVALYIEIGIEPEHAGRRAAAEVFGKLYVVALFSEADTIQGLLAKAAAFSRQGETMSNIGNALRVKYKLVSVPTEAQAAEWADLVEKLIREGVPAEQAGREAARRLFAIDDNLLLKAEADTIESLLQQAKNRK